MNIQTIESVVRRQWVRGVAQSQGAGGAAHAAQLECVFPAGGQQQQ